MSHQDRTDALLDQALEMTFPASDPFNVTPSDAHDEERTPSTQRAADTQTRSATAESLNTPA